ncbi:hypothetical protein FRC07_008399, partial [Ceratobasidium sp. 392]
EFRETGVPEPVWSRNGLKVTEFGVPVPDLYGKPGALLYRIRNPPPKAFPTSKTNIPVYNQATLQLSDPFEDGVEDSVRAYPAGIIGELEETTVEGRFDTVLVRDDW